MKIYAPTKKIMREVVVLVYQKPRSAHKLSHNNICHQYKYAELDNNNKHSLCRQNCSNTCLALNFSALIVRHANEKPSERRALRLIVVCALRVHYYKVHETLEMKCHLAFSAVIEKRVCHSIALKVLSQLLHIFISSRYIALSWHGDYWCTKHNW
jgi:hypothetical protein